MNPVVQGVLFDTEFSRCLGNVVRFIRAFDRVFFKLGGVGFFGFVVISLISGLFRYFIEKCPV
jgi:hypothetical protein